MLGSKFKETLICLKNLRVTLPYPAQPAPPPEGFRGKLEVSMEKCIGCGACANICPSRLISITDLDTRRIIEFALGRCTYCARCAEICPEKAISMSTEFEMATENKSDLNITIELIMVKCEHCGTAFTTQRIINKLLAQIPEKVKLETGVLGWLKLCLNCRQLQERQKFSQIGI